MPPKKKHGAKDPSCKPRVPKVPTSLLPSPQEATIPSAIVDKLEEFRNAQPFFSALERIAPEASSLSRMQTCWMGTTEIDGFEREAEDGFRATLTTQGTTYPVFLKRTHLLNPLDCIEGECIWPTEGSLPAPSELWGNALQKLNDPMNEAYVDAVFAMVADRMVSTGMSPHWLRCFGTFPARVAKYMFNISDEYSSLRRKSFWTRHQRMGIFQLRKEVAQEGTRTAKEPLNVVFSEESGMEDGDFEVAAPVAPPTAPLPIAEEDIDIPLEAEEPLQINAPTVRIQRIESPSSSSSETTDDFMDYFAEFQDFPVQVSLLERAEGTMDELLDAEEPLDAAAEAKWIAWIFQVIAGLAAAQHWFGFVHNDLHTNNVMWMRTEEPYLYYTIEGKGGSKTHYRVPTHGYIMKIIDFGRASYHLPEPAGFFISDAFYPGNDAAHQYNCEPFFDSREGKKVEPNPSFDLSRLAVSMLEALYPTRPANATPVRIMSREGPKTYAETVSPLYNIMWEWLTDDEGKNILRCPNGEERYPDFDLYSAIAADIHKAVPWQQLEKPLFKGYLIDKLPANAVIYSLWTY